MKTLQLQKTRLSTKGARYLYEIFEDSQLLCQRKSNRNYVACHVYSEGNPPSFICPMFYSSVELIKRHSGAVPYGIAYLATEKPAAI